MLIHKNDLLVMVVCNSASIPWMDLQKSFLHKTTESFDHAVFLNDTEYDSDIVIGKATGIQSENQHIHGLEMLMKYARSHSYKYYLVLDSDCFPIKKEWIKILAPKLKEYDAVSIFRTENCNIFPHPSVCFFSNPLKVSFSIREHCDLRNHTVKDVTCISDRVFPLLRTNRKNPNLLAAGIYYDIFYHHGCGSRSFDMRTTSYYDDIGVDSVKLKKQLFDDPDKFIKWLTDASAP